MYCRVKDEFEVALTVEGEDIAADYATLSEADMNRKFPWVVLSIELFISLGTAAGSCGRGDETDDDTTHWLLPATQREMLRHRLQHRMALVEHPLHELYSIMRISPYL